jgi:hypothetical protein
MQPSNHGFRLHGLGFAETESFKFSEKTQRINVENAQKPHGPANPGFRPGC